MMYMFFACCLVVSLTDLMVVTILHVRTSRSLSWRCSAIPTDWIQRLISFNVLKEKSCFHVISFIFQSFHAFLLMLFFFSIVFRFFSMFLLPFSHVVFIQHLGNQVYATAVDGAQHLNSQIDALIRCCIWIYEMTLLLKYAKNHAKSFCKSIYII